MLASTRPAKIVVLFLSAFITFSQPNRALRRSRIPVSFPSDHPLLLGQKAGELAKIQAILFPTEARKDISHD